MTKLKTTNNYNFKGSDKLQEVIKSKEYQKYKKEQDLKLQIAATKKLSKESSQRALTQAINLLSSQAKKGSWYDSVICKNGTTLSIQPASPIIYLANLTSNNLTSYSELEILIREETPSTNLKALKGIQSDGGYRHVPLLKVLELIKDNSE